MATDSTNLEGTQEAQASSSDKGNGQQSSEQSYVTVEQFQALQQTLEQIQRQTQGDKDRAVKKANERLDSLEGNLKQVLQLAQKDGRTITDLLAEAEAAEQARLQDDIRLMAESFRTGKFPTGASHGSEATQGVKMTEVLATLQLDLNDNRVKEFAGKQFSSQAEAYREGAQLIKTILTRQPTEADLPGQESERVRNAGKQEQLMAEYKAGSEKLRGQALINFKMQMRKKGLRIS
jgi:hypothetical protein